MGTEFKSMFSTMGMTMGTRVGIKLAFSTCSRAFVCLLMSGGENRSTKCLIAVSSQW